MTTIATDGPGCWAGIEPDVRVRTLDGPPIENPFFEVSAPLLSRGERIHLAPYPPADENVHHALRMWRADQARTTTGRVTEIVSDAQLHLMAVGQPRSIESLAGIPMLTATQLETYGDDLLRTIEDLAEPAAE